MSPGGGWWRGPSPARRGPRRSRTSPPAAAPPASTPPRSARTDDQLSDNKNKFSQWLNPNVIQRDFIILKYIASF